MMGQFYYRGALPPDSSMYVGRASEMQALLSACRPPVQSYAIVFGSRQSGKTTLLSRLGQQLQRWATWVRVDLTLLRDADTGQVCQHLAREIQEKLPPSNTSSYEEVVDIFSLASFLRHTHPRQLTVVTLDELGGLAEKVTGELAHLLRFIHEARSQPEDEAFQRFVFVLAGGLELFKPVSESPVSPLYNISEKIYLCDLTRTESDELLWRGLGAQHLDPDILAELCGQVFELARGHPYLTQRLGGAIEQHLEQVAGSLAGTTITDLAESLISTDEIHLRPMLKLVERQHLEGALRAVLCQPGGIRFSRHMADTARLELIGLVRGQDGQCFIRNRLYEQALRLSDSPGANEDEHTAAALRELIELAFSDKELRRFCHDRPAFRPIVAGFGPNSTLADMIDAVIEYCEKRLLFPDLVSAVQEFNPRQYESWCKRLGGSDAAR